MAPTAAMKAALSSGADSGISMRVAFTLANWTTPASMPPSVSGSSALKFWIMPRIMGKFLLRMDLDPSSTLQSQWCNGAGTQER